MAQAADRESPWIRGFGLEVEDAPVRLVCFPHAGGAASYYYPLATEVGAAADVVAVQYPGRQERRGEPACTTIEEMADRVHEELGSWWDRPVVFFGHSMGAVVAYEVARRLEREGVHGPAGLIASGRRAPAVHVETNVHLRGDASLIAELRRQSGTASSLLQDEEVIRMILPALRGDYRAIETYRHQEGPELTCPITALVGDEDEGALVDHVRAWGRHTHSDFELRLFSGGHFYLNEQWGAVGETVRGCLAAFGRPAACH